MSIESTEPALGPDLAHSFQIQGQAVRGRMTSFMGAGLNAILARHDYPAAVSRLLGEAIVLASLSAQSLKFEGRVMVQAEGDGPLNTLVAEVSSKGEVRAYARVNRALREQTGQEVDFSAIESVQDFFGPDGRLSFMILQDDSNFQPYQGVVGMSHATLAACAEAYFSQSEQLPTLLKLAVGEWTDQTMKTRWVARGMMVQQIAGDQARGETDDDWTDVQAITGTLTDAELVDPNISVETLLYRLFHEFGVHLEPGQRLVDACRCSKQSLVRTLGNMGSTAIEDIFEADSEIAVNCEFCSRSFKIAKQDVTG